MCAFQIRLQSLESSPMVPLYVMEAPAAPHWDVHAAGANFKNVQSNAGKIHRRDVLSAPYKEHRISARAASNVQRRARRQKWQQFADDTCGFRGRRLGR